jgi:hypothetical protein
LRKLALCRKQLVPHPRMAWSTVSLLSNSGRAGGSGSTTALTGSVLI